MLQMDVFNTFIELLRQTGNVTKGQTDFDESRQVHFLVRTADYSSSLLSKFSYSCILSSEFEEMLLWPCGF